MNLRHRLGLILALGLVLCLALLGREIFRPDDAEELPASSENVAAVAETSVPTAPPPIAQPAAAPTVTTAPNVPSGGGTFQGRVIDAVTREPVREFALEFHPRHQPQPGDQAPGARTFRTKDGRFEWQGIPPRLWMITASARGYQRFDLDQLQMQAGTATEVLMSLQRGHTLRGRVYDETSGLGIASASISFREAHVGRYEGNFRMRVRTTTGKDGSFVLEGVPAGSIILAVGAPKYVGREIDVSSGEQTPPLQIGLSNGGALKGYLATADGTPVGGQVSLNHSDGGYGHSTRTSDAGEFSFERLPPGRYKLTGQSGNRRTSQELSLARDERKEGFVLVLGGGRAIRGVVTGLRATDLERVKVDLFHPYFLRDFEGTRVDARGAYEIPAVEPGQVTVTASVEMRRQVAKTVQMPPDADLVVDLEFPRGVRLSGNVTRGGKPVTGAWVEARQMEDQLHFVQGVLTSGRGEYVIEDVPNGHYFILLDSYRSRNFEVNGDTVFDIDVPTTQFSARVVEDGGKVPVVDADVFIWSTQAKSSNAYWRDRSNHSGEFSITGLEPGDYLLSAYKPGYEMYRERISYNSSAGGMTIRLRQGQGVEVRLREAGSGRPIRNAQVGETIDGRPGSGIRLRLDENGVGYIPRALAGSTLTFHARSYVPAVVSEWGGQEMDVLFEKPRAQ